MTGAWSHDYRSWGGTQRASHYVDRPGNIAEAIKSFDGPSELSKLAYGCGRSYGDVALNPGGTLIDCIGLDRFIAFDRSTGILFCEAGVRLADILATICKPEPDGAGWLLPVTPGTRFVTVAGAIANDVHGKNHVSFGTFGRHVLSLDLVRSDGQCVTCSAEENSELFAATIGGFGLTGLIVRAKLQLRRVDGMALEAEDIQFKTLDDFFVLAEESDDSWEYTAAWIDCLSSGSGLGRGIYSRARHLPGKKVHTPLRSPRVRVPVVLPRSLVNPLSVRAFNALYWRKLGRRDRTTRVLSYESVLFPLDSLGDWNRLYGPRGFFQFQSVVPMRNARDVTIEMLRQIASGRQGSMLSVLKLFGDLPSPGAMSFPMKGITLALDFPNRGQQTRALFRMLEKIVIDAGGRIYPAKDELMSMYAFEMGYPKRDKLIRQIDPGFSSAFARRVGLLPHIQSSPLQ